MLRQYVIQTLYSQEALAHEEIQRVGFESVSFLIREEHRTKNGRHFKTVPLFPSYIFASFRIADDNWEKIANCRGVKNILGSDPLTPRALPLGTVEAIRLRFDAGEFNKAEANPVPLPPRSEVPRASISSGQRVLVDLGGSELKIGICRLSRGERIRVLMTYLGAEREIEVGVSRVRPFYEKPKPIRN